MQVRLYGKLIGTNNVIQHCSSKEAVNMADLRIQYVVHLKTV